MEGYKNFCVLIICTIALKAAASNTKESRTGGLHIPEKIIGGVIDIVQSHKNKPVPGVQPTYPPNYQQFPQYQQWNGQNNFQAQGFQTQPQFQGQYQNQAQYQNGYNQGSNYQAGFNQGSNFAQTAQGSTGNYNNQAFPAGSGPAFNQGQSQGQYQIVYQNPNQFGQQTNQLTNQQTSQFSGQNQASNQYQGSSSQFQGSQTQGQGSSSQFQGSQVQSQGSSGQFQGGQVVGQGTVGSGQASQGFLVTGGQQAGGQGPTCVCQAWTKPQAEILADSPLADKVEKNEETTE